MHDPDHVAIHTNRLVLRPYRPDDVDDLHALWTDSHVRRHLWDDVVVERIVVVDEVMRDRARFGERGFGQFAVRRQDADVLIGFCGFRDFHEPPRLELLFGLHPDWWGRGYADEAARAVIRFGVEEHAMTVIRASTDVPNVPSQRVLARLGMHCTGRETVKGLDTLFFELPAEAFSGTQAGYGLTRRSPGRPARSPNRRRSAWRST